MKANQLADDILDLIMAECRYWHGRDEARRGGFASLYASAHAMIQQAKSAPAEVAQGEVEIPDIAATFDGLYLVPIMALKRGEHLMTVAQHHRIVAALQSPDVKVPVTGSVDEIDSPVWPFINAEAVKVGAEKGRIETYSYERANGSVVVLWDGPRVHAITVTVRDDLNRTRCVKALTAPPSPDAELLALLPKWSERISKVWIGHAHIDELITIQREIDAKLAGSS